MSDKLDPRYCVAKITDVENALTEVEQKIFYELAKKVDDYRTYIQNKTPLRVIVIESDWPEFEPTKELLFKRINGGG